MAEIINLRRSRKQKQRKEKEKEAAARRIQYGQSKEVRARNRSLEEKRDRHLDGHLREPPAEGS